MQTEIRALRVVRSLRLGILRNQRGLPPGRFGSVAGWLNLAVDRRLSIAARATLPGMRIQFLPPAIARHRSEQCSSSFPAQRSGAERLQRELAAPDSALSPILHRVSATVFFPFPSSIAPEIVSLRMSNTAVHTKKPYLTASQHHCAHSRACAREIKPPWS
jgi:hypothetical protein